MRTVRAGAGRGFTLVELLVVVAIVALLAAILMPSLSRAQELTRRAVCVTQLKATSSGQNSYAGEHNGWLPWAPPNKSPGTGIWSVWTKNLGYYGTGLLLNTGYLDEPRVLYCPSWDHIYYVWNGELGWPEGGDPVATAQAWISCGYNYRATFGGTGPNFKAPNANIAGPDEPVLMDGFPLTWGGRPGAYRHHQDGYNVLHLDGSCRFYGDRQKILADWVDQTSLGVTQYPMFEEFVWDGFLKDGVVPSGP